MYEMLIGTQQPGHGIFTYWLLINYGTLIGYNSDLQHGLESEMKWQQTT